MPAQDKSREVWRVDMVKGNEDVYMMNQGKRIQERTELPKIWVPLELVMSKQSVVGFEHRLNLT